MKPQVNRSMLSFFAYGSGKTEKDLHNGNGKQLLLLWRDYKLANKVVGILRRHGYDVRAAEDVPAFRSSLEEFAPDLLLLEDELPDGNGITLCRELEDRQRRPWIILLSGSAETQETALRAGADDWIKIPYNMDILLARIAAILRRSPYSCTFDFREG